jgi:hypothetical protein
MEEMSSLADVPHRRVRLPPGMAKGKASHGLKLAPLLWSLLDFKFNLSGGTWRYHSSTWEKNPWIFVAGLRRS